MKQFLQSALPVLLSIILLSCSGGYEPPLKLHRNPQITLDISLNKSEYVEGEPLWLTAEFKNIGNKNDSLADINDEYAVYSNLLIESDSAPAIKYYGPVIDRFFPIYTVIKPGQTSQILIDIKQFWINNYVRGYMDYGYLLEGKYRVQSKYNSGWTQDDVRLQSNILEFRVVKPSADDSTALDTLVKIFNSKGDQARELYNFYLLFNHSVYAETAFYYYTVRRLLDYNKINIDSSFLNECYNFLDKYPYSYYKCKVLGRSLWAYQIINGKNDDIYKYFLDFMEIKYPGLENCINNLKEKKKLTQKPKNPIYK
jgi:hypothetical protein